MFVSKNPGKCQHVLMGHLVGTPPKATVTYANANANGTGDLTALGSRDLTALRSCDRQLVLPRHTPVHGCEERSSNYPDS